MTPTHAEPVAVNSSLSPSARMSTLERIGKVVRVLTTFCTAWRPLMICSFVMVRFMARLICSLLGIKSYPY